MKITILQSDILPVIQTCARFVTQRSQLPILSNIKLEAKGAKLIISATNLEMGITTQIGAKVETEGSITIPAKTFLDLISNVSDGQLHIEAKDEKLTITSNNSKTKLVGTHPADFPELTSEIGNDAISIPTDEFIKALPQVAFCSSPDDTRPALSGVLLIFDTGISLVATDGFRLSKKDILKKEKFEKKRFILPKGLIAELLKIVKDPKQSLKIEFNENDKQVIVNHDGYIITSRIVDGEYPNFEKIIPSSSRVKVKTSKADLLQSLKVVAIIAREAANIAEISVSEKSLTINAESNKSGEGESEVAANVEGGSLSIMFNFKFIIDFLNSIEGDNVIIELNDSSSAGVFRDSNEENYLHLIMPVKL